MAIMEFWTMEGYSVRFLKAVDVLEVQSRLGGSEVAGSFLSGGYF